MAASYLIIAAKFNELITKNLLEGALDTFKEHDINPTKIEVCWVPGAFEAPTIAAKAARSGKYDTIICLGAVIRGETPHFDFVAGQAAAGIMKVSIDTGVPIIFGILTTDTVEQALNRSGIKSGNKGRDATTTAIAMAKVSKQFEQVER